MNYRITNIQYDTKQVIIHLESDTQNNVEQLVLHTEVYVRQPLIIGEVIDQKRRSQYLHSNRIFDIEQVALKLISRRDISKYTFYTKMITKYPDEKSLINQIIKRYQSNGWLDDQRYASSIVSKGLKQYHGEQRIRLALQKAGFNEEEMQQYFPSNMEEISFENARVLAKKKLKGLEVINEKAKRSVAFRLQTMGYSSSTIVHILQNLQQIQTDDLEN